MVTVHSNYEEGKDILAFARDSFGDAPYIYCQDTQGEAYVQMLGGGQSWPHTLILDQEGVILAVLPRATTFEEMKAVIDGAFVN